MKNHDINQIQKDLLVKRKKYKILSFLIKLKKLVVDFIPLEEIPMTYCSEKIVLEKSKTIFAFLPKTSETNSSPVPTTRNEVSLYALQQVLVSGDSSFFMAENKTSIFYEKFHDDDRAIYLYHHKNIFFHSDQLAKIKNFPVKRHQYEAIHMGGMFSYNYYHFIIDILSKTNYLHHIPNHRNLPVILDISIKKNTNLRTIAEFFLKDYQIKYIDNTFYHSYKKLWHITSPNYTVPNIIEGSNYDASFTKLDPESILFLQNSCAKMYDESAIKIQPIAKIFMARRSELRKYNEVELLEIAKKYGFTPIYFEDLNIHEQIFIMRNADYIIGASGAAWTNLLFSKPKAKGLSWLGTVWGDFSVFSTLAALIDFDLYYIRNESKSSSFHEDYDIDTKVFEKEIVKLLES